MKLNRRQLRRLIESTIYEQKENKDQVEKILAAIRDNCVLDPTKDGSGDSQGRSPRPAIHLENALQPLFDINDKVILNQVGLKYMERDNFFRFGVRGNPRSLGKYLESYVVKSLGDDLEKYPHIRAIVEENS